MKLKSALFICGLALLGQGAWAEDDANGSQRQDRRPPMPQLDDATRAAIEACKDKLPDRSSGQRPTKEQMDAFRTCVAENGGNLPEPPQRGDHGEHGGPRRGGFPGHGGPQQ